MPHSMEFNHLWVPFLHHSPRFRPVVAQQEASCFYSRWGQSPASVVAQAHLLTFTNHDKLRNTLNSGSLSSPLCARHKQREQKTGPGLPNQVQVISFTFTGNLNEATLSSACHPAIRHCCPCHCLTPVTVFWMVSLMQWPYGFHKGKELALNTSY